MRNLVWKEQSTKRWIITTANSYDELHKGLGENRPEWFSTQRKALVFLKENFSEEVTMENGKTSMQPPSTFTYSRSNRPHPFNWYTTKIYLEGAK